MDLNRLLHVIQEDVLKMNVRDGGVALLPPLDPRAGMELVQHAVAVGHVRHIVIPDRANGNAVRIGAVEALRHDIAAT